MSHIAMLIQPARNAWPGNSAKAKIISEIVHTIEDQPTLIFDYGCGNAHGWQMVLRNHPTIKLVGYDPNKHAIQSARRNLQGLSATLHTGNSINELSFKADFIVSLSVFEHVYDRRKYLNNAKRLLAPRGIFYLNYDDGHFRILVDLNQPPTWLSQTRVWMHNLLAPFLARLGYVSKYQRRVSRSEVDKLVVQSGFRIQTSFYSNLHCFKGLYKHVSEEKRVQFMSLWLEVEEALNHEFSEISSPYLGDPMNLWRFMGSRTLVLSHEVAG